MKKIISIFLVFIYITSLNLVFAGNLYFVKNSDKEILKPYIEQILANKNYNIVKKDPYYATYNKNSDNYALIILQKSSANYFYYIDDNKNNKINAEILKALDNLDVIYEQSFNENYISTFDTQAQKIITNSLPNYSFDQNEQNSTSINSQQTNNSLKGSIISVPKGASFKAYLETPINTANANVGDEIRAVLSQNWVYNGYVIAPQGSLLTGYLTTARHATYGSSNGKVVFNFENILTPDGKTIKISTDKIDFTVTNDGKLSSSMKNVAVGAISGALVGLLVSAFSHDSSAWKSAAIGAGIGAGTGVISAAAQAGIDAEIPVYTEIEAELNKAISVAINY